MALLGGRRSKECRLQSGFSQSERPVPGNCQSFKFKGESHSGLCNTYSAGNLVELNPAGPQPKHFANLAHRCPLCWHPLFRTKAKGVDPNRASRAPSSLGKNFAVLYAAANPVHF
jgi:hypothetical protein